MRQTCVNVKIQPKKCSYLSVKTQLYYRTVKMLSGHRHLHNSLLTRLHCIHSSCNFYYCFWKVYFTCCHHFTLPVLPEVNEWKFGDKLFGQTVYLDRYHSFLFFSLSKLFQICHKLWTNFSSKFHNYYYYFP